MVTKILSISVSEEDFRYIKDDGILKPSSIFRKKVQEIRESRKQDLDTIKLFQTKCEVLTKKLFEEQEKVKDLQDQLVNYKK